MTGKNNVVDFIAHLKTNKEKEEIKVIDIYGIPDYSTLMSHDMQLKLIEDLSMEALTSHGDLHAPYVYKLASLLRRVLDGLNFDFTLKGSISVRDIKSDTGRTCKSVYTWGMEMDQMNEVSRIANGGEHRRAFEIEARYCDHAPFYPNNDSILTIPFENIEIDLTGENSLKSCHVKRMVDKMNELVAINRGVSYVSDGLFTIFIPEKTGESIVISLGLNEVIKLKSTK